MDSQGLKDLIFVFRLFPFWGICDSWLVLIGDWLLTLNPPKTIHHPWGQMKSECIVGFSCREFVPRVTTSAASREKPLRQEALCVIACYVFAVCATLCVCWPPDTHTHLSWLKLQFPRSAVSIALAPLFSCILPDSGSPAAGHHRACAWNDDDEW